MNIDSEYSKMVFDVWVNSVDHSECPEYHISLNSGNPPYPKAKL